MLLAGGRREASVAEEGLPASSRTLSHREEEEEEVEEEEEGRQQGEVPVPAC